MKIGALVAVFCLVCFVQGAPPSPTVLAASQFAQRVNDLHAILLSRTGADTAAIKERVNYLVESINHVRDVISIQYGITETDQASIFDTATEIGEAVVRENPSAVLELFSREPLAADNVRLAIVIGGLSKFASRIQNAINQFNGSAEEIFRLSFVAEYAVNFTHDVIEDAERFAYGIYDDGTVAVDNSKTTDSPVRNKRQSRFKTKFNINKNWSVGLKGVTYKKRNFTFNVKPTFGWKNGPRLTGGRATVKWTFG